MTSREPWRCVWCKRLNKHSTAQCGSCYTVWNKCIDIHYVHGQKNYTQESNRSTSRKKWQKEDWDSYGYSPRRRTDPAAGYPSPSPRKRTKASKQKKNKQQDNYGAPALDPPWQATASSMQHHAEAATSSAGGAEASLLTELVQVLESSDKPLSDEIQTVIEKAKRPIEPPPATAKTVRQTFDKLEKKRKSLQQAQNARAKLHKSWTQYVEESIKRWQTFATDFAKKDAELEQKVTEAQEALLEAKKKYDTAKEDNDRQDQTGDKVEEISDMEDEGTDKVVEKMATSEEIQANISMMVENLETLRMKPNIDQSEHVHKKQRTQEGGEASTPGFGASALTPFPAPGK